MVKKSTEYFSAGTVIFAHFSVSRLNMLCSTDLICNSPPQLACTVPRYSERQPSSGSLEARTFVPSIKTSIFCQALSGKLLFNGNFNRLVYRVQQASDVMHHIENLI